MYSIDKNYHVDHLDDFKRYLIDVKNLLIAIEPFFERSRTPEKEEIYRTIRSVQSSLIWHTNEIDDCIEFLLAEKSEENDSKPNYGLADLNESMENLKQILNKHDSLKSIMLSAHVFVEETFQKKFNKEIEKDGKLFRISFDELIYATHGCVPFGGDLAKIAFSAFNILKKKYGDLLDEGHHKIIETEKFVVSINSSESMITKEPTNIEDKHRRSILLHQFEIEEK